MSWFEILKILVPVVGSLLIKLWEPSKEFLKDYKELRRLQKEEKRRQLEEMHKKNGTLPPRKETHQKR